MGTTMGAAAMGADGVISLRTVSGSASATGVAGTMAAAWAAQYGHNSALAKAARSLLTGAKSSVPKAASSAEPPLAVQIAN